MPSRTIENYLKQLYLEQDAAHERGEPRAARPEDAVVPMGKLASAMGVVPGTATTMVKALADSGLVAYAPRGGVTLSPAGRQLALHVLRRHRLIEVFLVQILGLDWSEVHAEAEELEHVVSDKVLARIDALLGHPSVDPHGDPIPTAKGHVARTRSVTLADSPAKSALKVTRVLDQSPDFLQFVRTAGLAPGATLVVKSRSDVADAMEIRPDGKAALTLSRTVAAKFLVEAVG
jgi:DtxR family Mn-dependent transcriptional regulator